MNLKTIMYYPFICTNENYYNLRKWASWWGYNIVSFPFSIVELKKELLKINPLHCLVWDLNEIDSDDKYALEFYRLINQFQQQIYDLSRGKLILPSGSGTFAEKDVLGQILHEEQPPRIFRK